VHFRSVRCIVDRRIVQILQRVWEVVVVAVVVEEEE
jgi:hypothetical protein